MTMKGLLGIFGFIIICLCTASACSRGEQPRVARKAIDASAPAANDFNCDYKTAEKILKKEYADTIITLGHEQLAGKFADKFIVERRLKSADGQVIGRETHVFAYSTAMGPLGEKRDACFFNEVYAIREIGESRNERDFNERWIKFYQNDQLVYTDTELRDGNRWLRKYEGVAFVPREIPNWAARDGLDIYMTWVARSAETTSRVPVWGTEVVWQRDGDDFTLLAGNVFLKNPKENPTKDEMVIVMRFNTEGIIDPRGILFPVSEDTWRDYIGFLKNEKQEWRRYHAMDDLARQAFFDGPIKNSKSKELAQADVFARRGVMINNPDDRPKFGRMPLFDEEPQKFFERSLYQSQGSNL